MSNSAQSQPLGSLKIAYLFQQFPVPTETFAVSDMAALIAQGHQVTAYTMKFAPRNEDALREGLAVPAQLLVCRPTLDGALSWHRKVWRWRTEVAWLCRRIICHCYRSPVTCIQALLCVPRLAEMADSIADQ